MMSDNAYDIYLAWCIEASHPDAVGGLEACDFIDQIHSQQKLEGNVNTLRKFKKFLEGNNNAT